MKLCVRFYREISNFTNLFTGIEAVAQKESEICRRIKEALELLEKDVFHQQLKAHKLKGKLEGSWAYSTAYDLRVVFKIIQLENTESILLLAVGTHNEVY
jgi:addiction module RelE/StbE family toxin